MDLTRIADDLAPGDAAARGFDWTGLRVERIRSAQHPLFRPVYDRLWREFGARGEMEREAVIAARFDWDPAQPVGPYGLCYEMLAVLHGESPIAVRDHSVIVAGAAPATPVIVHLSHVIVEPPHRGTGLAAWLRALPIQTARECARAGGLGSNPPITLVAEMEHPDGGTPAVMARLRSYARAGFRQVDPDAVRYCQPDFRPAAAIERSGPAPVPLALIVRRIGREHEAWIDGAALRELVAALYTMFGVHVRAAHMAPLWASLDTFPGPGERVALRSPLA